MKINTNVGALGASRNLFLNNIATESSNDSVRGARVPRVRRWQTEVIPGVVCAFANTQVSVNTACKRKVALVGSMRYIRTSVTEKGVGALKSNIYNHVAA